MFFHMRKLTVFKTYSLAGGLATMIEVGQYSSFILCMPTLF